MNIILITQMYPLINRPDLFQDSKALHYFTRQWVAEGHNVIVFHMYFHTFRDIRKYKLYYGRKITKTELDGVQIYMMENRFFSKLKYLTMLQRSVAARNYNKIIQQIEKPDILLVHMPCEFVGFLEKLTIDCKRVAILHNSDLKKLNKSDEKISYIKNYFDAIGFRSLSIQKRFNALTKYEKNQFVVYSGAPNVNSKIGKKMAHKCMQILYVGKLVPLKNVDITLKALAMCAEDIDYHLSIVGAGGQRRSLEELTKTLNITDKVTFFGEMSRSDVLIKMSNADIFVMVSSPETFGLVYVEAMSFGCITIGSRGEGIDGIIKDRYNGFLVEPGDVIMLAKCIKEIAKLDGEQIQSVSERAIYTAQNMTEEKMANEYLKNITKVLNDKKSYL